MRAESRWLIWKPQRRGEAVAKVPIIGTVDDPATWLAFGEASHRAARLGGGIGFALGDGWAGFDFDDAVADDGTIHAAAARALNRLESYAELSPSGKGIHILIRAALDRPYKLKASDSLPKRECYDSRRFFTVSGARIGAVAEVASGPEAQRAVDEVIINLFQDHAVTAHGLTDGEIVEKLRTAKNRVKAQRLFDGDISAYPSASEADLALCRILAYYSRDQAQIDRLLRLSGLYRTKWDERRCETTYGAQTIAKALSAGGHRYREMAPPQANCQLLQREQQKWGHFHLAWLRPLQGMSGAVALRVLCCLATYADGKTGIAFPKIDVIAAHTGLSRRSVMVGLNALEGAGIMTRTRRWRDSSLYQLHARMVKAAAPVLAQKANGETVGRRIKKSAQTYTVLAQKRSQDERALGPLSDQDQTNLDKYTERPAAAAPRRDATGHMIIGTAWRAQTAAK
jgi:putative DNA primase/helicase